ncbi:alpha/beta hydrolase [Myroides odoratimimus]|uniref:alpha/beta hydrolase n=1 Tax=Myroides odoratimimus TaxID=76832 RepID=UPI001CE14EBE|nr:alpha/beta hydrolase [Myroides odoratimimus]MCA4806436.1 alpha/beta hydrolase [Myroides odoratimimus]MDM1530369.1 alpha/beta hydrolase [Myroides odoratimimus]
MKNHILTITLLLLSTFIQAQKVEQVFLGKEDKTKNYYTIIYPSHLPWSGYLVLIPGFGESAEKVLLETDLPLLAAKSGMLVIIPCLQDGVLSFGVDKTSQSTLGQIIEDVRSKHKLMDQRFFIGGFSIGGSTAIKYAQETITKPHAVFAIDPPLDFERFYNSSQREIRLSGVDNASEESVYMIGKIEEVMGGTPATALEAFYSTSPYSFTDPNQTAVKKFGQLPLRIYTEPDVNWWIHERGEDLTSMNATESSAFINELRRLGNEQATLITISNKGYRMNTQLRHPHSWMIVNNQELIQWLLSSKY